MYNGLGLKTARGSGTNGYIQRNLSFAKPKTQNNFQYDHPPPKPARKPSAGLTLHRNKRQVEVECLEYEEKLLESGKYSVEEVKMRVSDFRKQQLAKLEENMKRYSVSLYLLTFHRNREELLKEQKEVEMDRLKNAFGIGDNAVEGQAFKFESETERQERLAQYAEEERLERKKRLKGR